MKQLEINKKAPYVAPETTLVLLKLEGSLLNNGSPKRNKDKNELFWLEDEEEYL